MVIDVHLMNFRAILTRCLHLTVKNQELRNRIENETSNGSFEKFPRAFQEH